MKKNKNIQLLSPKVIDSTHGYMNQHNNYLTITNALEIYFLLLTPDDFFKYASVNTIENKWMWGVDFLFGHFKIKCGIINKFKVVHKFKQKNSSFMSSANSLKDKYLKKNEFASLEEVQKKYPVIIKHLTKEQCTTKT